MSEQDTVIETEDEVRTTEPQVEGSTDEAEGVADDGAAATGDLAVDEAEAAPDGAADADGTAPRGLSRVQRLEQEGEIAADYLEELLDIADLDGDLDMDVDGDRAAVSIVGADLNQLVGDHGEVLEALQELTRLAVYRETGERSRLMLDISGHRAERRTVLEQLARDTVAQVKASGEQVSLSAMSPFERKVVHDAVADAGLTSESDGVEPRRFVIVLPG